MADGQSMTIEEVVRQVMVDEHADVLRESVRLVAQQVMESEVSELVGAAHGERNPGGRLTQRSGRRARERHTRVGGHRPGDPEAADRQPFPALAA
jgi:putative transposase